MQYPIFSYDVFENDTIISFPIVGCVYISIAWNNCKIE